eukprot:996727-Rhodomonas_salina.1
MWASATTTRKEPKKLLLEFLAVTGLKIGQLRTDNKLTASSTFKFKAFCEKQDITLMPSVAYTHTMQSRAEGAVRICKEHLLCLLKSSNTPPCFGPFALLHFCRVYNYWPCATSAPWESMKNS